MRKTALILTTLLLLALPVAAQKYACVNTDYVLRSIPDYTSAQKRLDRYVADWQKEISDKMAELDGMRADYDQETICCPRT